MLNGLITAIRTLTILPIPGQDTDDFPSTLYWFVPVGLLLGSILYLISWLIGLMEGPAWHEGTAVLILVVGIFLTRGFHLDGLADFADGFWGGYDREKTLAIMKDSFIGTFAVVALVLILLAKWVVLVRLLETNQTIWIVAAFVTSRTVLVELTACMPYARENGTAALFVRGSGVKHRLVALVSASALLYLIFDIAGLILLMIGLIFSRLFGLWCLKRVGGITGDLLGTSCELTETLVYFLAVIYEIGFSSYF
ncbi:adenosylcobinamide-GDP ribazoletransferase [bacterium]|nr:adenosylcobinamide-GDP ribazoletransferase [bacterium]